MTRIVVFSGSGVSADSGIPTYRSEDGLWANYRIDDVCTPWALEYNRATVIEFYNKRRRECLEKEPNEGHRVIAGLEKDFEVEVVTQNIDNLHERAGSTHVTHLHGELMKLRSMRNPETVVPIDHWEQDPDEKAKDGGLLRPHIVFFGEAVPMFEPAARIVASADVLVIVGTSLAVYPAASLVAYVRDGSVPVYLVDPGDPNTANIRNPFVHIRSRACEGMAEVAAILRERYLK